MFRRQEDTLEPDPKYPVSLKELGYFVDNSTFGCIRNIQAPEHYFDFHHTNNDRHNEMRGEAMRTCQREEVLKRLRALGIQQLYLPALTYVKPDGPHIPILSPPAQVLKTRKRVILVINDDLHQDLGILAYRQLQRELGLNGGSVVNFAKEIITRKDSSTDIFRDNSGVKDDTETPGLIVTNAGQLLYSHKFNKALSIRSWNCLPRKSICHDGIMIDDVENRVEGHRTPQEHIKSVFDTVIKNPNFVSPDAEVYVIAIENGIERLVDVLKEDFAVYASHITAVAVISSLMHGSQISKPALKAFLHQRGRQWKPDDTSIDPEHCTELPLGYVGSGPSTSAKVDAAKSGWLEAVGPALAGPANGFEYVARFQQPANQPKLPKSPDPEAALWTIDPICPTFAGGDTSIGECVFTLPSVQRSVLKFFELVAQDPKNYRNPSFTIANVPHPTPDEPLTFSADETGNNFSALPSEMASSEQQELIRAKEELECMEMALAHTPFGSVFEGGRQGLRKRLVKKEAEIAELSKKVLATGGLGAGAAEELREKWETKKAGPVIPFAGVEMDSEVVKGAGCLDTAEEELKRLEMGDGEDRAS